MSRPFFRTFRIFLSKTLILGRCFGQILFSLFIFWEDVSGPTFPIQLFGLWCFSATFTARLVSFSSEVLRRGCFQANNDSPVQFFGGGCFWAASTPAARLVQVSGFELPLRRAHSTMLEHTISVKGVCPAKRGGCLFHRLELHVQD